MDEKSRTGVRVTRDSPTWLGSWCATLETIRIRVEPSPASALAALFDDGLIAPDIGDILPPLWHFASMGRWEPARLIGSDGHAQRGDALPPVPLSRRMFGASRIAIAEPLRIGESVSINREVIGIEEKHGRTGDLVIVTIRNSATRGSTAVAYVEIQQIVFRDSSDFQRRADTYEPEEEGPGRGLYRHTAWEWRLHCDPVVLMRFSSATANTHRIHYDHAYATHVEGYPELVVQGPLLALCMAEILRLELPRYRVREFAFRAVYPAFSGQTVRFVGKRADASDGVQVNLTALVGDSPCMTGQAVLAHA